MQRYLVDLIRGDLSLYDYQGFDSPDHTGAVRMAELIAIDLEHSRDGESTGWTVAVRDARGEQLFSTALQDDRFL